MRTFHGSLLRTLALLLLLSNEAYGQTDFKADDLAGDWLVHEKTAVIRFFRNGDKFYGLTAWMQRAKDANGNLRTDVENPDPAKRSQPLLGALLCRNFVYEGKGLWTGGTIYDSRSGKTYQAKITMKDINTIVLRGYIGISLIGGSTVWTRKEKK